jgi:prevent-host-death family protein
MTSVLGVGEAKKRFSELMSRVTYGRERFLIRRRGRPMAALVSADDLARLEQEPASVAPPQGALALVGAWREVDDQEMAAIIADIYAERDRDMGRPVSLEA